VQAAIQRVRGGERACKNPNLAAQVNTSIAGPLKGLKLKVNSVEMQSLIMYIVVIETVTAKHVP